MHSPIIAIAHGVPAIHLRQPTDTRKGQMWRDVGLANWLFEIEEATGEAVAARLLEIHRNPDGSRQAVERARAFTSERGRAMMEAVRRA
jgi:polysaccharide pyruvyl transferase WcaK-like protein